MTDQNNQISQPPNRLVTLRWLDSGTCPDETLASLVERYRNPYAEEMIQAVEGIAKPVSTTTFVQGNAVDFRITSFHGLIDLDRDLYPILTNACATNEQVFSKAAFSLEDMGMDSGDKLLCLRSYIKFVQHTWALPGLYIGLSMHVVREIASLAYWKNYTLEFRLDKRGNALGDSGAIPPPPGQGFRGQHLPGERSAVQSLPAHERMVAILPEHRQRSGRTLDHSHCRERKHRREDRMPQR